MKDDIKDWTTYCINKLTIKITFQRKLCVFKKP